MHSQQRTGGAKRLLHSYKVKDLTRTAKVSFQILHHSLTLARFPMCGREPFKTRFQHGIEIQGFNQIKKIVANYSTK